MGRVLQIALREFLATVGTKGFIVGVLLTPLITVLVIWVMKTQMDDEAPRVTGELAVLDPTGSVTDDVREYLSAEAIAIRRERRIDEETPEALQRVVAASGQATEAALEAALGEVPDIRVVRLGPAADLESEKSLLLEPQDEGGGRLALAVIDEDAVEPADGSRVYGTYDLYVREKLDDRIEDELHKALQHAIVGARIERRGLDRGDIEKLTKVEAVRSTTVTAGGERVTNQFLNFMLPAAFMALLLVSVLTSGQYLLTTTIEEKSSRVVEVLLSAVSPMQLMTGKILGQLGVGLVILGLYSGLGISALFAFALAGVVDFWLLVYLVLFFGIAYFIVGSLMAAIGAAVNEMREAQTLMTPIMVLLMLPWLLWWWIAREPNSLFATVLSFLPPVNTFAMLLRMASTSPPPPWQVWTSIAIGVASVYAALWFAAKVFRVGLLMYGKPPNFATLLRWVRLA